MILLFSQQNIPSIKYMYVQVAVKKVAELMWLCFAC